MAYTEVSVGSDRDDDREFVSAKIGLEFEGVFRSMSRPVPSQYGGEYRVVSFDLVDGRKIAIRATRIFLERLEAAELSDGDKVKVIIESKKTKDGKRTYGYPRVFVDRQGGQPTPAAPAKSAPVSDDDIPF